MDRKERRLQRRLAAKKQKEGVVMTTKADQESSPERTSRKKPPSRPKRKTLFEKILSTVALLSRPARLVWTLVGVVFASALGLWAVVRPHVSVEPYISLNPVDPYRTQFTIKNENNVFGISNVTSVCWPRRMESSNNIKVLSLAPLQNISHVIPTLEPNESSTIDCPSVIGGVGTYTGQVDSAELEIEASYRQFWWPSTKYQRFAFKAVQDDTDKSVHWVHITPAEERPIFTEPSK